MPPKTSYVTENILRQTPLPQHGRNYAVIAHGDIINRTRATLSNSGFEVEKELYKCSKDGQIAQGIYHLVSKQDPEIGMMFAWANSYNKLTRFKCAVGARVFICDNGMVSGDAASYSRVHKGKSALTDVMGTIDGQIKDGASHFLNLITEKEMLKDVILDRADQASVLGHLYALEEVLTVYQASIVKKEMDKPSYDYGVDPNSAWALYNHVTHALKESHPGSYLRDHETVHRYFIDQFGHLKMSVQNTTPVPSDLLNITEEKIASDVELMSDVSTEHNMFGVQFS